MPNANVIMLLLGFAMLGVLVLTVLWGFFGGLKRELKHFAFFLAVLAIVWLCFGNAEKLLDWNVWGLLANPLRNVLNIPKNNETFREMALYFAQVNLPSISENLVEGTKTYALYMSAVGAIAKALCLMISTLVVFLLGMLCRVITHVVWLIYRNVNKEKIAQKEAERAQKPAPLESDGLIITEADDESGQTVVSISKTPRQPYRGKRRLWGAGLGLLKGLMIVVLLCVPLSGIFSILETVEPETLNTVEKIISKQNGATIVASTTDTLAWLNELVDAYNNSAVNKAVKSSSYFLGDSIDLSIFDSMFTIETGTQKLVIREEVVTLIEALNLVAPTYDPTCPIPLDIWELDSGELDDLFDLLAKSKLFVELLPVAVEYVGVMPEVKELLKAADAEDAFIKLADEVDWAEEFPKVLTILRSAIDVADLNDPDLTLMNLDSDALRSFIEVVSATKFFDVFMPAVINYALSMPAVKDFVGSDVTVDVSALDWRVELLSLIDTYDEFKQIENLDFKNLNLETLEVLINDEEDFAHLKAAIINVAKSNLYGEVIVPVLNTALDYQLIKNNLNEFAGILNLLGMEGEDWAHDLPILLEMSGLISEMGIIQKDIKLNNYDAMNQLIDHLCEVIILSDKVKKTDTSVDVKTLLVEAAIRQFGFLDMDDQKLTELVKRDTIDWNIEKANLHKLIAVFEQFSNLVSEEQGFAIVSTADFKAIDFKALLDVEGFWDVALDLLNAIVDSDLVTSVLPTVIDKFVAPTIASWNEDIGNLDVLQDLDSDVAVSELYNIVYLAMDAQKIGFFASGASISSYNFGASAYVPEDGFLGAEYLGYTPLPGDLAVADIIERVFASKVFKGREDKVIRILLAAFLKVKVDGAVLAEIDYSAVAGTSEKDIIISGINILKPILTDPEFALFKGETEDGKPKFNLEYFLDKEVAKTTLNGVDKLLESDLVKAVLPEAYNQLIIDKGTIPAEWANILKVQSIVLGKTEGITADEFIEDINSLIDAGQVLVGFGALDFLDKERANEILLKNVSDTIIKVLDIVLDLNIIDNKVNDIMTLLMKKAKLEMLPEQFEAINWETELVSLKTVFTNAEIALRGFKVFTYGEMLQFVNTVKTDFKSFFKSLTQPDALRLVTLVESLLDTQIGMIALPEVYNQLLASKLPAELVSIFDVQSIGKEDKTGVTALEFNEDVKKLMELAKIFINAKGLDFLDAEKSLAVELKTLPEAIAKILPELPSLHMLEDKMSDLMVFALGKAKLAFTADQFENVVWADELLSIGKIVGYAQDIFEYSGINTWGDLKKIISTKPFDYAPFLYNGNLLIMNNLLREVSSANAVPTILYQFLEVNLFDKTTTINKFISFDLYNYTMFRSDITVLADLCYQTGTTNSLLAVLSLAMPKTFTVSYPINMATPSMAYILEDILSLYLINNNKHLLLETLGTLLKIDLSSVQSYEIMLRSFIKEEPLYGYDATYQLDEDDYVLKGDAARLKQIYMGLLPFMSDPNFPIKTTGDLKNITRVFTKDVINAYKESFQFQNYVLDIANAVEGMGYLTILRALAPSIFAHFNAPEKKATTGLFIMDDLYTKQNFSDDLVSIAGILRNAVEYGWIDIIFNSGDFPWDQPEKSLLMADIIKDVFALGYVNRHDFPLLKLGLAKALKGKYDYELDTNYDIDLAADGVLISEIYNEFGNFCGKLELDNLADIISVKNKGVKNIMSVMMTDTSIIGIAQVLQKLAKTTLLKASIDPLFKILDYNFIDEVNPLLDLTVTTPEDIVNDLNTLGIAIERLVDTGLFGIIRNENVTLDKIDLVPVIFEDIFEMKYFNEHMSDIIRLVFHLNAIDKTGVDFDNINWSEDYPHIVLALEDLVTLVENANVENVKELYEIVVNKEYLDDKYVNDANIDLLVSAVEHLFDTNVIKIALVPVLASVVKNIANKLPANIKPLVDLSHYTTQTFYEDILTLLDVLKSAIKANALGVYFQGQEIYFEDDSEHIQNIIKGIFSLHYLEDNKEGLLDFATRSGFNMLYVNPDDIDFAQDGITLAGMYDKIDTFLQTGLQPFHKLSDFSKSITLQIAYDSNAMYVEFVEGLKDITNLTILKAAVPAGIMYASRLTQNDTIKDLLDFDFSNSANADLIIDDISTILDAVCVLINGGAINFYGDRSNYNFQPTLADAAITAVKSLLDLNILDMKSTELLTLAYQTLLVTGVDYSKINWNNDKAIIKNVLDDVLAAYHNTPLKSLNNIKNFISELLSKTIDSSVINEASIEAMVNALYELKDSTILEESFIPLYNRYASGFVSGIGNALLKDLLTLEADYNGEKFMEDYTALIALVKDHLLDFGIVEIITRDQVINWGDETTVEAVINTFFGLNYFDDKESALVGFGINMLKSFYNNISLIDQNKIDLSGDKDEIFAAYLALKPIISKSGFPFNRVSSFTKVPTINLNFFLSNEVAYAAIDAINVLADASIVKEFIPYALGYVGSIFNNSDINALLSMGTLTTGDVAQDIKTITNVDATLYKLVDMGLIDILNSVDTNIIFPAEYEYILRELWGLKFVEGKYERAIEFALKIFGFTVSGLDFNNIDSDADLEAFVKVINKAATLLDDTGNTHISDIVYLATNLSKLVNFAANANNMKKIAAIISDVLDITALGEFGPAFINNNIVNTIDSRIGNLMKFDTEYSYADLHNDYNNHLLPAINAFADTGLINLIFSFSRPDLSSHNAELTTIVDEVFKLDYLEANKADLVQLLTLFGFNVSSIDVTKIQLATDSSIIASQVANLTSVYDELIKSDLSLNLDIALIGNTSLATAISDIYNALVSTTLAGEFGPWGIDLFEGYIANLPYVGGIANYSKSEKAELLNDLGTVLEKLVAIGVFSNTGVNFPDNTVQSEIHAIDDLVVKHVDFGQLRPYITTALDRSRHFAPMAVDFGSIDTETEIKTIAELIQTGMSLYQEYGSYISSGAFDKLVSTDAENDILGLLADAQDSVIISSLLIDLVNAAVKVFVPFEYVDFDAIEMATYDEFEAALPSLFEIGRILESMNVFTFDIKQMTYKDGAKITELINEIEACPFVATREETLVSMGLKAGLDINKADVDYTSVVWANEYNTLRAFVADYAIAVSPDFVDITDTSTLLKTAVVKPLVDALEEFGSSVLFEQILPTVWDKVKTAVNNDTLNIIDFAPAKAADKVSEEYLTMLKVVDIAADTGLLEGKTDEITVNLMLSLVDNVFGNSSVVPAIPGLLFVDGTEKDLFKLILDAKVLPTIGSATLNIDNVPDDKWDEEIAAFRSLFAALAPFAGGADVPIDVETIMDDVMSSTDPVALGNILSAINASYIYRTMLPDAINDAIPTSTGSFKFNDFLATWFNNQSSTSMESIADWAPETALLGRLLATINMMGDLSSIDFATINLGYETGNAGTDATYAMTVGYVDAGLRQILQIMNHSKIFNVTALSGTLDDYLLGGATPIIDSDVALGTVVNTTAAWDAEIDALMDLIGKANDMGLLSGGNIASAISGQDSSDIKAILDSFNSSNMLRVLLPDLLHDVIANNSAASWEADWLKNQLPATTNPTVSRVADMTTWTAEIEYLSRLLVTLDLVGDIGSIDFATIELGYETGNAGTDSPYLLTSGGKSAGLRQLLQLINYSSSLDINNLEDVLSEYLLEGSSPVVSSTVALGTVTNTTTEWNTEIDNLLAVITDARDLNLLSGGDMAGNLMSKSVSEIEGLLNKFNNSSMLRVLLPDLIHDAIANNNAADWEADWLKNQLPETTNQTVSRVADKASWTTENAQLAKLLVTLDLVGDINSIDFDAIELGYETGNAGTDSPYLLTSGGKSAGLRQLLQLINYSSSLDINNLEDVLSTYLLGGTNPVVDSDVTLGTVTNTTAEWNTEINNLMAIITRVRTLDLFSPSTGDMASNLMSKPMAEIKGLLDEFNESTMLRVLLPELIHNAINSNNAADWEADWLKNQLPEAATPTVSRVLAKADWTTEIEYLSRLLATLNIVGDINSIDFDAIELGYETGNAGTDSPYLLTSGGKSAGLRQLLQLINYSSSLEITHIDSVLSTYLLGGTTPIIDSDVDLGTVTNTTADWNTEIDKLMGMIKTVKDLDLFTPSSGNMSSNLASKSLAQIEELLDSFNESTMLRVLLPELVYNSLDSMNALTWASIWLKDQLPETTTPTVSRVASTTEWEAESPKLALVIKKVSEFNDAGSDLDSLNIFAKDSTSGDYKVSNSAIEGLLDAINDCESLKLQPIGKILTDAIRSAGLSTTIAITTYPANKTAWSTEIDQIVKLISNVREIGTINEDAIKNKPATTGRTLDAILESTMLADSGEALIDELLRNTSFIGPNGIFTQAEADAKTWGNYTWENELPLISGFATNGKLQKNSTIVGLLDSPLFGDKTLEIINKINTEIQGVFPGLTLPTEYGGTYTAPTINEAFIRATENENRDWNLEKDQLAALQTQAASITGLMELVGTDGITPYYYDTDGDGTKDQLSIAGDYATQIKTAYDAASRP